MASKLTVSVTPDADRSHLGRRASQFTRLAPAVNQAAASQPLPSFFLLRSEQPKYANPLPAAKRSNTYAENCRWIPQFLQTFLLVNRSFSTGWCAEILAHRSQLEVPVPSRLTASAVPLLTVDILGTSQPRRDCLSSRRPGNSASSCLRTAACRNAGEQTGPSSESSRCRALFA